jgi:hypothetical protein
MSGLFRLSSKSASSLLQYHLRSYWYNLCWSNYVGFIDGWVPRFAFFVPLVGYLILFNDWAADALVFERITSHAPQNLLMSSQARLRMIYFGLIFLGVSNLLYRMRRPSALRFGTNKIDAIRNGLDYFTIHDFIDIHETIESKGHKTLHGKYETSEWEGFKRATLNKGDATERLGFGGVVKNGNWEMAKQEYGSLLRSMLHEWFFREDTSRRVCLILCLIFSTSGYLLLAYSSLELFLKVFISTFYLH